MELHDWSQGRKSKKEVKVILAKALSRNQGNIRAAQAEVRAAEARAQSIRINQENKMREAHAQLTAALTQSRTLKTDILPRAETVRKAGETRNAAGDLSLSELLILQRDWATLKMTYLESLRDVMEAWAELSVFMRTRSNY